MSCEGGTEPGREITDTGDAKNVTTGDGTDGDKNGEPLLGDTQNGPSQAENLPKPKLTEQEIEKVIDEIQDKENEKSDAQPDSAVGEDDETELSTKISTNSTSPTSEPSPKNDKKTLKDSTPGTATEKSNSTPKSSAKPTTKQTTETVKTKKVTTSTTKTTTTTKTTSTDTSTSTTSDGGVDGEGSETYEVDDEDITTPAKVVTTKKPELEPIDPVLEDETVQTEEDDLKSQNYFMVSRLAMSKCRARMTF